jgi:hypothetical protein
MTFPEFITYCELNDLFNVQKRWDDDTVLASIKTPDSNIALYLIYRILDKIPGIKSGHFYKYTDHEINTGLSYAITMAEIEKVFFPSK